jgi:hypothetical protein
LGLRQHSRADAQPRAHSRSPRPSPAQIVAAVAPVRDQLDACCIFPSMPAVMKLNKLGTFSMAQLGQSKSVIGERPPTWRLQQQ